MPVSTFRHRLIAAPEAAELVSSARSAGKLVGVSQVDLAAPYQRHALVNHTRLCERLRVHGVELTLADFFALDFINPLELERVRVGQRLLVIDANFICVGTQEHPANTSSLVAHVTEARGAATEHLFELAPDTMTFHLIECWTLS